MKNRYSSPLRHALLLLATLACGLGLTSGCQEQPATLAPKMLAAIPQQSLRQIGNVYFVRDPAQGFQLSQSQKLPCLLFFTADWCTYCHDMQHSAFLDPSVEQLSRGFVCIEVDADRYPRICREFGVSGYPTVQFIAADGRKLHRLVGRQSSSSLANGMRAARQRLAWLNGDSPTVL